MFIASLKIKKQNIITVGLCIVLIILVIVFIPLNQKAVAVYGNSHKNTFKTSDEIVEWLTSLGWEVDSEPFYEKEVKIPRQSDELYDQYIINQRKNGYKLYKYKGKTVKQYKYNVLNYDSGKTEAYINLLLYKDKVIAADICSPMRNGFMKPLVSNTDALDIK